MGLLDWFRRGGAPAEDPRVRLWKQTWAAAAAAGDASAIATLGAELDRLGLSDDDLEIEREMLDGLQRLADATTAVDATGLPAIETGHRVVGSEPCHFTAPVSMPDEPAQPGGRLLLTRGRAIFVGGANGTAIAWHTVGQVWQVERDLLLIRSDREAVHRFRCNSFGDAMCAAFLARKLIKKR